MKLRAEMPRVISILLLCVCTASLARAQGVGAIGGTVVDASGAVLPGVTVTLSNPGTIGGNRDAVTDDRGTYQFTRLVPGRYSVRAELAGFRPLIQQDIVVNADFTARADLRLELGSVQESVTVSGQQPLLDTTTALNQTVMDRQVLDVLPGTNDLWGVARLVPSVLMNKYDVGGSESFQQSKISVHGSNPDGESQYQVDGMNIDAPVGATGNVTMYYDPFMYEEINYKTSNGAADTARGGIVYNMVTKTGTNTVHGAFMFNGSNQDLQSNNITPELRRDLLAAIPARALAANPNIEPGAKILHIFDTGGYVAGPILRDRLWYAGTIKVVGLDQLRVGSYNPDGTQFVDDNFMKTASAKISWAVSPRNQIHFNHVFNNKQRFHYNGNVTTDFVESRATWNQTLRTNLDQTRWTSTLSPRLLLDVSGSVARTLHNLPPQDEVKDGDVPGYDVLTQTNTTAWSTYSRSYYTRGVVHASLSYTVAAHDLQAGYQYDLGKNDQNTWSISHYPSGLRAIYRNGVPDSVNTYNTPTYLLQYIQENAVFVQDKWAPIPKLTLNVGLRVEKTNGWMPDRCQTETIFIAGRCFGEINDIPSWLDVAPRFALIYDIFGNGRTAVKLGANRYNVGVGTGHLDRVDPVRTTMDTRSWIDRNGDRIPQLDELGASTGFNLGTNNRYNPDVKRPYAAEYSVEVEQQLPSDIVVSAGYFRRQFRRGIGSRNLAVPTDTYIPLQVTEVSSGRQITVYNQSPALRGRFDVFWDNLSELDSVFNGVDLNFNKRFNRRWMMMGGVSLGKNYGDIFPTGDLNNPNFQFRRGLIGNDVPVSFKLSGSYQLPYGLLTSGVVQHYTGFPETTAVSVGQSTVALTQVTQSIVVEPRGTTRLPDVNLVDFNVRKIFRVRNRFTAQPVVEMFNILNTNAIQARTAVLGPAYGRAANIVRGRMLKFGLNVNF